MSLWDPQVHDDLLNYQVKRIVNLGGAPAIRLCEGGFGITRSQWRLLAALVEEGPRSASALAQRCLIERARTSRLLAPLVDQKLVERLVPEKSPARRTLLAATGPHAGRRHRPPRGCASPVRRPAQAGFPTAPLRLR